MNFAIRLPRQPFGVFGGPSTTGFASNVTSSHDVEKCPAVLSPPASISPMTLDDVSTYQSAVQEVRRRQRASRLTGVFWLAAFVAIGFWMAM